MNDRLVIKNKPGIHGQILYTQNVLVICNSSTPLLKEHSGTERVKGIVARMVRNRIQLLYDTVLV